MRIAPFLLGLLVFSPVYSFSRSNHPRRPANSSYSFCGTYPGRTQDELRKASELREVIRQTRKRQFAVTQTRGATQDINDIAVIEDDGDIVLPAHAFDLANTSFRLTPNSSTSYTITRQSASVNQTLGTKLTLTDDDTREIVFSGSFRFPYFGTTYSSVFINSDGNITFTEGDTLSTDRDLSRFNEGPPRIAPFFADLDPSAGQGGVYYNQLSDRFLITWNRIREFEGTKESTFQVGLFPDGSFEITFGTVIANGGIVGWTTGRNLQTVSIVDLSSLNGTLLPGPTAERFSQFNEVDSTALVQKFYETHPDEYSHLTVFTNFAYDLGSPDTFAFEMPIKNDIRGIGIDIFDFSQEFGSNGNLESYLAMNQLSEFPSSPDTTFLGTNSTIDVMGQESGHRWLAYLQFKNGTTNSKDLLGRDEAHWSFFFNSDASEMEGNSIRDNGNGSFTTTDATQRYSKLDQYAMGLIGPSEVGPLFYVTNVSGTTRTKESAPEIGVTFRGTRKNLTIDDIIAAEGPRVPDVQSSPKAFRQAFILLVRQGTAPTSAELDKLSRIRQRWQEFFFQATDGRGSVDTALNATPLVPAISSITPTSGSTLGNTRLYISGSNFQNGAAVLVGGISATDVQVISPSLIIARTGSGSAGVADVVVKNPDAEPSILANAYVFRVLAAPTISATALRIPYVVDSQFFRSNLGMNNPNSAPVVVHLLELDNNGLLLNQLNSISIPATGFVQKNNVLRELEGTTAVTGREGSLVLESDQPIQAFSSQIDNQSGDPSILEAVREGSAHLLLQSAANTGPFRSNLVVLNLSPSEARVSLTARNRDSGQPIGTPLQDLSVPGNGFASFENILSALSLGDYFGPVEILSTNGTPLVAVSQVSGLNVNTSGFFVTQPLESGTQTEIVPFVIDTDAFRTNLGLNNLGTTLAAVNVSLVGQNGNLLAATTSPVQVAPLGLVQINHVIRYLLNGSSLSAVTGQQGYLKITANVPVKAFATQIDNVTNDPSIETSVSGGSSDLLLQSSANTNFLSTLSIVNPNNSANTITLISREGDPVNNGAIRGTKTIVIPPNGSYVTDNLLQEIGSTSSFGPIEIHAVPSLPIIAVSRVYARLGNTSGFFNVLDLP